MIINPNKHDYKPSLGGIHLQSQSVLYHVNGWYNNLVINQIGQLCPTLIIGRWSVNQ